MGGFKKNVPTVGTKEKCGDCSKLDFFIEGFCFRQKMKGQECRGLGAQPLADRGVRGGAQPPARAGGYWYRSILGC